MRSEVRVSRSLPVHLFLACALGILLLGALSGCDNGSPTEPSNLNPAWLRAMVAKIESEPVTNPPSAIYRYQYRGATVYFRPARCCDFPSELYDESGALICQPDGSLSGRGNENCPDFFSARTNEALIWQDPRR
jgi:uncharacterized protein DUF6970